MIESKTTYTLICESCLKILTVGRLRDREFDDPKDAEAEAEEQCWRIDCDQHFCPDCFDEDEEEEE